MEPVALLRCAGRWTAPANDLHVHVPVRRDRVRCATATAFGHVDLVDRNAVSRSSVLLQQGGMGRLPWGFAAARPGWRKLHAQCRQPHFMRSQQYRDGCPVALSLEAASSFLCSILVYAFSDWTQCQSQPETRRHCQSV
jgi:hypothetical protein